MLKIEKFIGDKHETTFRVPGFVVGVANALLPEAAHISLATRGIKLREIAEARKNGTPYSVSLAVREHGINKKIIVSLV